MEILEDWRKKVAAWLEIDLHQIRSDLVRSSKQTKLSYLTGNSGEGLPWNKELEVGVIWF